MISFIVYSSVFPANYDFHDLDLTHRFLSLLPYEKCLCFQYLQYLMFYVSKRSYVFCQLSLFTSYFFYPHLFFLVLPSLSKYFCIVSVWLQAPISVVSL